MTWRERAFERLASQAFDLIVIGGGIVGARVAYDAARAGLRVALLEAADFGGATSGASSKLVHGGFRYLPGGHLHLVWESQVERQALLHHVAPNLVSPIHCLLPAYAGSSPGAAKIAAGLAGYRSLAGHGGGRVGVVSRDHARRLVPVLRSDGLRLVGTFEEAQVHDGRLVLATVRGAADAGAVVLNHARVTAIQRGAVQVAGQLPGEPVLEVRGIACVNAAGPWVDRVRRLEDPGCAPLVRLSLGVHVVLTWPPGWDPEVAVAVPVGSGRVLVAQPWFGVLLLGTTDREFSGEPGAVQAPAADCAQLLCEASRALGGGTLDPMRVLATYSGLRALPLSGHPTAAAPREHMIGVGRTGLISVAGGKLTTHRRIALEVLRRVPDRRVQGLQLDSAALPGTGTCARPSDIVEGATWRHLERLYGSDALRVAERGRHRPDLLSPIRPGGLDIWAQWEHALDSEWAVTEHDILRNRTTVALRGGATPLEVPRDVTRALAGRPAALAEAAPVGAGGS